MDFRISHTGIEQQSCLGAQPGRVYCGDVACLRCGDIPFPTLERVLARRKAVADAPVLPDFDGHLDATVHHAHAQVESDPATAQALREGLPWTLARCHALAAPIRDRLEDLRLAMGDGLFGMENLAEAELQEILLVDVPLLQEAQSRIINAAVYRAVPRARLSRRGAEATDAMRTRRHATTEALAVIALAVQASRTYAGRRSCTRGDDPDAASATIGLCSGHVVMEKPSTLRGVGGFLCDRLARIQLEDRRFHRLLLHSGANPW